MILARFDEMQSCEGTYYVFVIEDTSTKRVVSSCTVAVEKKFIRGCSSRGRIEDVVVDADYRGKQLGKLYVVIPAIFIRCLERFFSRIKSSLLW